METAILEAALAGDSRMSAVETAAYEALSRTTAELIERVFIVSREEIRLGRYPSAQPVILVDLALIHRYEAVRELELCDAPGQFDGPVRGGSPLPIFVIHPREVAFYEGASLATIVEDRRSAMEVTD